MVAKADLTSTHRFGALANKPKVWEFGIGHRTEKLLQRLRAGGNSSWKPARPIVEAATALSVRIRGLAADGYCLE